MLLSDLFDCRLTYVHRESRQQQHSQACSKCIQLGSPRSSNHFHGNGTVGSSHSLSLLWLNWCTHVTMDNLCECEICSEWLVQTNNQSCQCGACSGLFRLVQTCLNYSLMIQQPILHTTYICVCLFVWTNHSPYIIFNSHAVFNSYSACFCINDKEFSRSATYHFSQRLE